MRILILMIAIAGMLLVTASNAQSERGHVPDHVSACAELKGGTKGLYGLCVSFCARQNLTNVDLNDIESIKAASPDISTLRQYNALRKRGDPEMPCFQNGTPPDDDGGSGGEDDSSGGGTGDSGSGGNEPPPVSQCACWTGSELASIDGELVSRPDLGPPTLDCTELTNSGLVYQKQAVEGYELGLLTTVEGVAWASVDTGGDEPYNGCLFSNSAGERSFPLEQADANQCVQEIIDHCALFGNP